MPRKTIPRDEYDEMRHGSRTMQDALEEMVDQGYTPESLPQAEKPSLMGFGRHLKEKAGAILDSVTNPGGVVGEMRKQGRRVGANLRYAKDLDEELSKPEGMNLDEWGRILRERRERMEE